MRYAIYILVSSKQVQNTLSQKYATKKNKNKKERRHTFPHLTCLLLLNQQHKKTKYKENIVILYLCLYVCSIHKLVRFSQRQRDIENAEQPFNVSRLTVFSLAEVSCLYVCRCVKEFCKHARTPGALYYRKYQILAICLRTNS